MTAGTTRADHPTHALWTPVQVGDLALPHRLAMAPMTRNRSGPDGVPTPLNAEYYAQRATMAMVVTEGTQPSPDGQGYLLTPGIHTAEQVAGWRTVADAVHAADGRLVVQLMHVGRAAHPANTPHGRTPVGPSAVAADALMVTAEGRLPMPVPRALGTAEIRDVVTEFRHAAASAIAAGADGVEIHGANGYLLHQFLSSNANLRDDGYGGSVAGRIRLTVEVAGAVADEIGPGRTGLRISPGSTFNDIREDDTPALYTALVDALAPLGLAYLHVAHAGDDALLQSIRDRWPGAVVVTRAGADLATRAADVQAGLADVVAVARMSLANPDLVARVRSGAPLNAPDRATFYGGDERGYTDYPTLTALGARSGYPG